MKCRKYSVGTTQLYYSTKNGKILLTYLKAFFVQHSPCFHALTSGGRKKACKYVKKMLPPNAKDLI